MYFEIEIGGDFDKQERYIGLTIMTDVKPDDPIMKQEIFGPILPIITVSNAKEAVRLVQ